MRANARRRAGRLRGWLGGALLLPALCAAQALPAVTATPGAAGGATYSLTMQTLLLLTLLSFLPAIVLMMTSFTRIIIVLSLLRQALGTQTAPPNQVLLGLALFLTLFIMQPVASTIYTEAYLPLERAEISVEEAVARASGPLKRFMLNQAREPDLELFTRLADLPPVATPDALPLRVVVPAFVTSELKTAFQIGFIIFIPFLVIDLVVASVLMSMGMMMVSPILIALPFKLILFVLIDGWTLVAGSLVQSFAP